MRLDILTIFPEIFTPLDAGVTGKARRAGVFSLRVHNIRDYAEDERGTVDDRPYGGGPGMVMKPGPIVRACEAVLAETGSDPEILVMSPRGSKFTQSRAEQLSKKEHIIIICGRYEGIDERVLEILGASEVSVGDFILSGGELPAMAVAESVVRLLPGALGDENSVSEESFSGGLLEYPQYTRPESFRGLKTPWELLSGDHGKIKKWRQEQAKKKTRESRPDLLS